jgi:cytochrome b pre-mRNA-processing protein 3
MQRAITSHLSKPSITLKAAQKFAAVLPNTATTYATYGVTESLFTSCSTPTNYTIPESSRTQIISGQGPSKTPSGEEIGQPDPPLAETSPTSPNGDDVRRFFFHTLNLLPTFSTWSQTTFLHMYLLTVRLRALPPVSASTPGSFQNFQQNLVEHFSQSAELKMNILHTITARGIRNRYLKDLFIQWRGVIAAYDQGMVEGDAVLGAAVWRNLWKGEEEVDWVKVGLVVAYMRKAVVELEKIEEIPALARALDGPNGVWARSVRGVEALVVQKSDGAQQPL